MPYTNLQDGTKKENGHKLKQHPCSNIVVLVLGRALIHKGVLHYMYNVVKGFSGYM